MLIIKTEAETNGAHANQYINGTLSNVPDGFAVVPEKLEAACMAVMPFFTIQYDEAGSMTGFTAVEPPAEAEAATAPTPEERMAELESTVDLLTVAILEG